MQLPGWDAALEEVKAHHALASGSHDLAVVRFRAAAERFRDASQPLPCSRGRGSRDRPARVLLVDVREPGEAAHGVIPGAVLVPRGMLEFHADGASPSHLDGFDPGRRVIPYCAAGSRSALAARSLQELGYRDVAHLHRGLDTWIAGRPVAGPMTAT